LLKMIIAPGLVLFKATWLWREDVCRLYNSLSNSSRIHSLFFPAYMFGIFGIFSAVMEALMSVRSISSSYSIFKKKLITPAYFLPYKESIPPYNIFLAILNLMLGVILLSFHIHTLSKFITCCFFKLAS